MSRLLPLLSPRRTLRRLVLLPLLALGCAVAPAGAVTLVEPGHSLRLIADSASPVHPSQVVLGFFPGSGLESITVDDATGLVYVQVSEGGFGCPSGSTAIHEIDPVTGLTTTIAPFTGFGICDRGSDIDIDPTTGLLLAQDLSTNSIATVDVTTGVLGTWVSPAGFTFGVTFGTDFGPGVGVIPAADATYLGDLGTGIHSAPLGGPETFRIAPPGGGDDLYVQPDGDVVFVGDFSTPIIAYEPVGLTPVPAALPPIVGIFADEGLLFGCGSRATSCPDTGEGFVSWSCPPGGSAVFRLDEPLTTATLVLTMDAGEGIQDLSVGPASSGIGTSLYLTVVNQLTAAHQVWEVTEACGAGDVPVDIKPGSCPNSFNRGARGVLPVALLGTADFDAEDVDVSTLSIARADGVGGSLGPMEGPPGPHTVLADVATPFPGEPCDCHELEGDGVRDVSMKFFVPDLVAALELDGVLAGDEVELVLSGALTDGTAFSGSDCIRIVPPARSRTIPSSGRRVR